MSEGLFAALEAARRAPLGPPDAPAAPGFDPADLAAIDAVTMRPDPVAGHAVDWFGLRTPLDLAPELAAWPGGLLPKPLPHDPRALPPDWVALACSVAEAEGAWRGLSIGTGRGDLLLAGAVAARRRGLAVHLAATEADGQRRSLLRRHAGANDLPEASLAVTPGRVTLAGPGTTLLSALLDAAPRWDWVRIAQPGLVVPAVTGALGLLGARLRLLALVTRHRGEEARAAATLAEAGWRLIGEAPSRLSRADPRKAEQPGVQAWRAPG